MATFSWIDKSNKHIFAFYTQEYTFSWIINANNNINTANSLEQLLTTLYMASYDNTHIKKIFFQMITAQMPLKTNQGECKNG